MVHNKSRMNVNLDGDVLLCDIGKVQRWWVVVAQCLVWLLSLKWQKRLAVRVYVGFEGFLEDLHNPFAPAP